ncbi:TPA: patatin family protein [Acinetobacter baumannii]|uniref:Esterase n=1 Tax=Acinetobacter baumannii EGD-HP18 TaxID=1358412 RepID=A0AAV3JX49_ACIBA|nr:MULTISPECIES: patatin family protein [Acinetobacter]ERH67824.1 esterase [Acinetobacter baumannii EGD-HP18]MBJ9388140.1 patatin family protein [Acinetobacter baumannii]MBJ9432198.1 patatin family protein [Acinetobacter baumannii]MCE6410999.1 patatin family protein [Acinetobacter baumannii]MCT9374042.1 patatin family protein [Acinetobacter baumannii]
MTDFSRNALVVEGGGMRGAFTSGVLDAFLQQQFNPFDLYVGVSSGSTNVANYLAGQQGRTLTFYIDHSLRPEFIDYKRFFKGGDLLDLKWMWEIGEQEHPLDQQSLFAKNPDFYMVLTHAKTGQAEYLRAGKDNLLNALRASSSIPVLTRHPVDIMGEPYFDGGVADALPVRWTAQQSGVKKLLVLRTRPKNYFKASSRGDQFLAKYAFKHHYGFANSLRNRCARYNASVEFVRSSNPEQQILEVCPPPLKNMAGRLTTNPKKLRYSYEVGLETGLQAIENWNAMK